MASSTVWADFETLRHNVKHNTVDRLKQILTGFNEECGCNFIKSGKKQELIDRITREMDVWRSTNNADRWSRGKQVLNQVRSAGVYSPRMSGEHSYSSASGHNAYPPPASTSQIYHNGASSSAGISRYDPYAPPRRPPVPSAPAAPVATPSPTIRFKPSPFFRVERAVSAVIECPESTSSMDRRQQSLMFTMNNDILAKLNSTSAKYQLRLYCTSSTFHQPANAFRGPSSGPCPIEFPPTCEVRVNNVPLTANLKGMKKKPGTAPPPDLGKSLRLSNGASNRVEMVYVNSQQPVLSRKYYLMVMLVETTSVDQLIDRLKKGKYKSSEEIQSKMAQAASADDDIIAGHQKMSLKCPLSYMRISTPCRSSLCVHSQCFDALSWFSLMEQTTTWLCPVCERVLNVDDLIVDGYFDGILKATPEEVEDVIVEADGQWHSEDNKYGSAEWMALHPPVKAVSPLSPAPATVKQRSQSPAANTLNGMEDPRQVPAEIVILDSEDEDEGRVKRELSPSNDGSVRASRPSASHPPRSQTHDSTVIDLTLDSDDEELPPPTKKRKIVDSDVASPTEPIWKKSRMDGSSASPVPSSVSSASYMNGSHYPGPVINGSSASAGTRYTSSYSPPAPGVQAYPGFAYAQPIAPPLPHQRLPPSSGSSAYQSRTNGAGSLSPPNQWRA